MRSMRNTLTTLGLFSLALMPLIAAVPPEPPNRQRDSALPVAIVQPLAGMEAGPLVFLPGYNATQPILPESGLLIIVGSAMLGLATIVRRTTRHDDTKN